MQELLIALVLMFIGIPGVEGIKNGDLIEAVLLTLVLVSAVLAVRREPWTLAVAGALVVPAVACKWLNHYRPDLVPPALFLVPALLFVIFVIAHLLGFILRAPRVDSQVLCAGVCIYLLLGLLWAFGYELVAELVPDSFAFSVPAAASHSMKHFNAFYFSFITLTTVGYGDITPVSNIARMLAIMEAISGTLFVGVLIARLVSLYSGHVALAEAGSARETVSARDHPLTGSAVENGVVKGITPGPH